MAGKEPIKSIIDYGNTELRTFNEKPFGDVDSLILSQFSYMHFNGVVGGINDGKESITIKELLKTEYFSGLFNQVYNWEKCKELLFALGTSPRFRDIGLNYYEESTNEETQEQFSSICYMLNERECYVAYRGTDTTLVGWREDFNMAFLETIPSQTAALNKLSQVINKVDLEILVGGHSKGGNLAEYAGAMCSNKGRIKYVFSHDGPGFRKDIFSREGFNDILPKVRKTVPGFSLVGRMLQGHEKFRVVNSDEKFLMQHDPFSWQVEDGDFVYIDDVSQQASAITQSVNEWLLTIDDYGRKKFVDALFNVMEASNINCFDDFTDEKQKSIYAVLDAIKEIDPDTKKFVSQTMKSLFAMSFMNITGLSRLKSGK